MPLMISSCPSPPSFSSVFFFLFRSRLGSGEGGHAHTSRPPGVGRGTGLFRWPGLDSWDFRSSSVVCSPDSLHILLAVCHLVRAVCVAPVLNLGIARIVTVPNIPFTAKLVVLVIREKSVEVRRKVPHLDAPVATCHVPVKTTLACFRKTKSSPKAAAAPQPKRKPLTKLSGASWDPKDLSS